MKNSTPKNATRPSVTGPTRPRPNPGGFSLGRIGPVTEGLFAFLGLLFFMVLAAMWITAKHRKSANE